MKHGATNTFAWAVQTGAVPSRIGDQPSHNYDVQVGYEHHRDTSGYVNMMHNPKKGLVAGWKYDSNDISPEIWVVRTSADVVSYLWEAESKFDQQRDSAQPFVDVDERRASLIPSGGSIVQAIYPADSVLTTLETDVGSTLPAWVSDTDYSGIATVPILLQTLFTTAQQERGLSIKADISAVLVAGFPYQIGILYIHLWMRQCAKILYNYRAESLVELYTTYFKVDSDGLTTKK